MILALATQVAHQVGRCIDNAGSTFKVPRLFHPVLSEEPARVTNLANKLMLRLERGRLSWGGCCWKITMASHRCHEVVVFWENEARWCTVNYSKHNMVESCATSLKGKMITELPEFWPYRLYISHITSYHLEFATLNGPGSKMSSDFFSVCKDWSGGSRIDEGQEGEKAGGRNLKWRKPTNKMKHKIRRTNKPSHSTSQNIWGCNSYPLHQGNVPSQLNKGNWTESLIRA